MKNILYIAPMVVFAMMFATSFASTAIGVSFPKVVPSHVTLYLNDSRIVNFTFTLYNGSAGTTCIGIPNSEQLQANGTYTNVVPSSGIPNFNGTMTITTKPNAVPGNYTVQLAGGCADPTTHGIAVVYLQVLNMQKPMPATTTIPTTTTTPSNTITTIPTTSIPSTTVPATSTIYPTPPPTPTSSNAIIYILVAIVIIAVIIIIAAFLKLRSKY